MNDLNRRKFLQSAGVAGIAAATALKTSAAEPAPKALLTDRELADLRHWDTPTIANALERLKARDRLTGFMRPDIRCIFPEMGITNGYAATATIQASRPRKDSDAYVERLDYWEYINSIPKPSFMVIHDLDAPKPIGSWWGEVNANVHRALGCAGVITDGGVRDLSVVRPLGFHFFAAEILVSHAYVHLVDFGKPVTVGGVTINSGDLVQADEHGVIQVPSDFAKKTGPACHDVFLAERALVNLCQTPGITFEKMKAWVESR